MWLDENCPKCHKPNFIYCGDMNDLTDIDPVGCKCWHCDYCFSLETLEEIDEEECDDGEEVK